MENYKYKYKVRRTSYDDLEHWVVATNEKGDDLFISKIAPYVRFPKAVAEAMAQSLNQNPKLKLQALI